MAGCACGLHGWRGLEGRRGGGSTGNGLGCNVDYDRQGGGRAVSREPETQKLRRGRWGLELAESVELMGVGKRCSSSF